MDKWTGSTDDLRLIVEGANVPGEWRAIDDNQEQYRTRDGGILSWWKSTGRVYFQGPSSARDMLQHAVDTSFDEFRQINGSAALSRKTGKHIFVVHGHDRESREQLELVLHRLRVTPFVLMNTSGGGLTIIEALERQIGQKPEAEFGIVLCTPDDMGYSVEEGATAAKPRARQNVVLEMGMLVSSLGRQRVVIILKGYVDIPSDASGVIYLRFERDVREIAPQLAERLQNAGFEIAAADISAATR